MAISLVCETYAFHLPDIEEYLNTKIDRETFDQSLLITPEKPAKPQKKKSRPAGKNASRNRGGNQKNRRQDGKPGDKSRQHKPRRHKKRDGAGSKAPSNQ
jgi:hypothetical protein